MGRRISKKLEAGLHNNFSIDYEKCMWYLRCMELYGRYH